MALRTLSSLGSLAGKRVLVRCDLNVPLKDGVITDDGRIRASLPTLNALLDQGARVVVMSHLGRPDGAPEAKYSLEPAAIRLGELLGKPVVFATDTVGDSAKATVSALADGQIAVLENLRFNPGETSKDEAERGAFAAQPRPALPDGRLLRNADGSRSSALCRDGNQGSWHGWRSVADAC